MHLFHNSNVFGSRVIHILYTGCAKIKKNNSGAKSLMFKMLMKPEFSRQILKNNSNSKFHENPSTWVPNCSMRADEQTNRQP